MDDGVARRLAGRVAERVVRKDHSTEVEEAGQEEHQDRQDQGELDHGLAAR